MIFVMLRKLEGFSGLDHDFICLILALYCDSGTHCFGGVLFPLLAVYVLVRLTHVRLRGKSAS